MPPVRFGLFTFIGALPWCAALAGLGYGVGSNWTQFSSYVKYAGYLIAVILVVIIARFFIARFRSSGNQIAK
ncbi:unnamed protein product [Acidithrix sp. C25]|nr:unnamed protein product [Acidithrix sp. C25]